MAPSPVYRSEPPGTFGIDQFLSEPDDIGRGLGTRALEEFLEMIRREERVSRFVVDPDPANKRAIRCYEKAGFRHFATRPGWNGAMAYQMELVSGSKEEPS